MKVKSCCLICRYCDFPHYHGGRDYDDWGCFLSLRVENTPHFLIDEDNIHSSKCEGKYFELREELQ